MHLFSVCTYYVNYGQNMGRTYECTVHCEQNVRLCFQECQETVGRTSTCKEQLLISSWS
jgi:hypothetical protein